LGEGTVHHSPKPDGLADAARSPMGSPRPRVSRRDSVSEETRSSTRPRSPTHATGCARLNADQPKDFSERTPTEGLHRTRQSTDLQERTLTDGLAAPVQPMHAITLRSGRWTRRVRGRGESSRRHDVVRSSIPRSTSKLTVKARVSPDVSRETSVRPTGWSSHQARPCRVHLGGSTDASVSRETLTKVVEAELR
jgi:hypothetical protein